MSYMEQKQYLSPIRMLPQLAYCHALYQGRHWRYAQQNRLFHESIFVFTMVLVPRIFLHFLLLFRKESLR